MLWPRLVLEVVGPGVVQAEGGRGLQAAGGLVHGGMVRAQRCRVLGVGLQATRGQSRGARRAGLGVAVRVSAVARQRGVVRARVAAPWRRQWARSLAVGGQEGRPEGAVRWQASVGARFGSGRLSGCGKVSIGGGQGAGGGGAGGKAAIAQRHAVAASIAQSHDPKEDNDIKPSRYCEAADLGEVRKDAEKQL